jgi:hypothetical protein
MNRAQVPEATAKGGAIVPSSRLMGRRRMVVDGDSQGSLTYG